MKTLVKISLEQTIENFGEHTGGQGGEWSGSRWVSDNSKPSDVATVHKYFFFRFLKTGKKNIRGVAGKKCEKLKLNSFVKSPMYEYLAVLREKVWQSWKAIGREKNERTLLWCLPSLPSKLEAAQLAPGSISVSHNQHKHKHHRRKIIFQTLDKPHTVPAMVESAAD